MLTDLFVYECMFMKKSPTKWSQPVGDFFQVCLHYLGKKVQTKLAKLLQN